MTFGEHLEELRGALSRALVGLVLAFLVALLLASTVVRWIQSPLEDALARYYQDVGRDELSATFDGNPPSELLKAIDERGLVPEKMFLQSDELAKWGVENPFDVTASSGTPSNIPSETSTETPPDAPSEKSADRSSEASSGNSERTETQKASSAQSDETSSHVIRLVEVTVWRATKERITALAAHEAFMIWIKAALVISVILSSPWLFWQIWQFVAAGLYPNEKRYVYSLLPFGVGLFLSGCSLAFFFVFKPVLDFLFKFNHTMNIDPDPRIGEWVGFVLLLPIGFGVSFQLPLVMLLLERIGIFTREMYISNWRVAIVAICVISMLLTPADPVSMLLMAVPLTALYFLGIGICRWAPGTSPPAGYDPGN